MITKKSKMKMRYRMCLLIPLCGIILMAVFVSIGSYWGQISSKYQEKRQLEAEITALKEKEVKLRVDVNRLEDPNYVARYAREKYMYSKDGEILLRLPE